MTIHRRNTWKLPSLAAGTALLALAGAGPAHAAATKYKVVPNKSKVTVTAGTGGLVRHDRNLGTGSVSGSVTFNGNKPTAVQVTAKAGTLKSVDSNVSAGDKAKIESATRDKILEAGTYPNISFTSTRINLRPGGGGNYSGTVIGKLNLHGVSRLVTVPVTGKLSGNTLRGSGTLNVDQTDYGITLLSLLGGALTVKDPVRIRFDIVAQK
jgi:polyisoprenoid-binding protein YceI